MEHVRQHVKASGSGTVRGFFKSKNAQYDPDSLSLRDNIKKAKCQFVYSLADGHTSGAEERAIRDTMRRSENSYELLRMVFAMRGWAGLDDELQEAYLDPIAVQIAQVLDQRDYSVYRLIRRHLPILDYTGSANLGDCFVKILSWPPQFIPKETSAILASRGKLLRDISSATRRGRHLMVGAARISPSVIALIDSTALDHKNELVKFMYQANYTTRICTGLEMIRYDDLYQVLFDMADPGVTDSRQRQACRDAVDSLTLEFAATEGAVKYLGSSEARVTVGRFMTARKAALDTFTLNAPPSTIFTALAGILDPVATTISELKSALLLLPDILTASLTLPDLTGASEDDKARHFIGEAHSQQWLARLPASVKVQAINACLGGGDIISAVDDDDESAINTLLGATKEYEQAELYQLAAAAGWERLDSAFDGEEYNELVDILNQPV